jgi:hypothetical protein
LKEQQPAVPVDLRGRAAEEGIVQMIRNSLALAAAVVLSTVLVADAAAPTIDTGAVATAAATSVPRIIDAVSVSVTGEITPTVRDKALAAARSAGAPAVVGSGFSAGLIRVRRGTAVVQQSRGSGWAFPMAITALPTEAIGAVMGRAVSGPIASGMIVMGQSSAALRGAQQGDVVDMRSANGITRSFMIGAVIPDSQIGGTELVVSIEQANLLFDGAALLTRVLIYGPSDRNVLEWHLAQQGLTTDPKVRVSRSWDLPSPDSTLSTIKTKQRLGEFDIDYANLSLSGWTAMNPTWVAANLPARRTYPTGIRALCHNAIHADLTAALQEVVNAGLAGGIDVANANTYGGCATGQARFSRITGNLGSVSRHSWGQPLDTNTVTNCQGCVPKMDCRIVRIFRKHNFAWGGNFLTSDGMHFEWVGERRDTIQYPSKYCANLSSPTARTAPPQPPTGLGNIFGDDAFSDEH